MNIKHFFKKKILLILGSRVMGSNSCSDVTGFSYSGISWGYQAKRKVNDCVKMIVFDPPVDERVES